MGIVAVAVAALAVSAGSAYMSYEQQKKAERNQKRAANEQRKINAQQEANNAQQAAREQRQQIREERVRRARILQSSENMGVGDSSGALGATGSLATNLSDNLGSNLSALRSAQIISRHSQRQADFMSSANQNMANANMWGQVSSFSGSMFQAAGGWGSLQNLGRSSVTDVSGTQYKGVKWGFSSSI